MKKLILFAFALMAFVACSDDDNAPRTYVLDFESAQLGTDGFVWGKSLATEQDDLDYMGNPIKSNIYYGSIYDEELASTYTYYSDYGHTYDSWNAFVVSNKTDMETAGFANDKSVYATGGANNSKQFAMGYCSLWTPDMKGVPVIKFKKPVLAKSVFVANSTYLTLYMKNDVKADAWKDVVCSVKGMKDGKVTSRVDVKLVDAKAKHVAEGWQLIDISKLGVVSEILFEVTSDDQMAPSYVAVDDLVYEEVLAE